MADPTQTQTSSTFPNPPDFLWKQFTPDKVARLEALKKAWRNENPAAASSKEVTLIPNLPEDLQHLQPPPEPEDGVWRTHGGQYKVRLPFKLARMTPSPPLSCLHDRLTDRVVCNS